MANIYNFSRNALLHRIGLSPNKKLLIFFISSILLTIPLGYVYNSVAVIVFVLYSLLAARKQDAVFCVTLALPVVFFLLMALSLMWSIDFGATIKALSKEAALLFLPIAFMLNRKLGRRNVSQVLFNFSLGMCVYGLYYIGRACIRYYITGNPEVFFYHELTTLELNAIYISVFFSIAMFYFLTKKRKSIGEKIGFVFMLVMIFLLSSKTIIITDVALIVAYYLFYSRLKKVYKIFAVILFCVGVSVLGYYSKIGQRLEAELKYKEVSTVTNAVTGKEGTVHNVTIGDAWSRQRFEHNDYFGGTAFRVYQIRIFSELLNEEAILLTGYGLNASAKKIEEKGIEHNVFPGDGVNFGYNKLNFHNQYIEAFADLGILGLIIVLAMLGYNLKNSVKSKYFLHIAFAVLMITLFLTESFLWRQRGVVFFTLLYCLFNDLAIGLEKEKHEKNTNNRGSGFPGVASV